MFQPNFPGGVDSVQLNAVSESELGIFSQGSDASVSQNRKDIKAVTRHIRAKGFQSGVSDSIRSVHPLIRGLSKTIRIIVYKRKLRPRGGRKYSRRHSTRNGYKPASIHLPETGKEVALLDVSHPEVQIPYS